MSYAIKCLENMVEHSNTQVRLVHEGIYHQQAITVPGVQSATLQKFAEM